MDIQCGIILHTATARERDFLRGRQLSAGWFSQHIRRFCSPYTLRRAVAANPFYALRNKVCQHRLSRLAESGNESHPLEFNVPKPQRGEEHGVYASTLLSLQLRPCACGPVLSALPPQGPPRASTAASPQWQCRQHATAGPA